MSSPKSGVLVVRVVDDARAVCSPEADVLVVRVVDDGALRAELHRRHGGHRAAEHGVYKRTIQSSYTAAAGINSHGHTCMYMYIHVHVAQSASGYNKYATTLRCTCKLQITLVNN